MSSVKTPSLFFVVIIACHSPWHPSFNHRRKCFFDCHCPGLWNTAAENLVGAVTVCRKRPKTHLFNRSFPKSPLLPDQWLCYFRHYDRSVYLLTYLVVCCCFADAVPQIPSDNAVDNLPQTHIHRGGYVPISARLAACAICHSDCRADGERQFTAVTCKSVWWWQCFKFILLVSNKKQ